MLFWLVYFQFQCILFYTSSGYYQLVDLLYIRRLHQLCKFFILKLWHNWCGMWIEKCYGSFLWIITGTPSSYLSCRGAKLNNGCGCPLSRRMLCLLLLSCTKFGQLILRKIIKIIDTRCHILRLKCTKIETNKFVRPRWPYDMRPSASAEKYIRDAGP